MNFEVGSVVGIPARYAKGPFNDELLVSIDMGDETISGFVIRENIRFVDDSNAFVRAKILRKSETGYEVKLYGHFFTTNGIEPIQSDWANKHLQAA